MELSGASARWWVLDTDHRARRREATLWTSTGHAAAVYGDELYDNLPQTRGNYGRLQDFGICFGCERVVLHPQPHDHAGRLECDTALTRLLLEHEPLPWARWGEESIAAMPDEIRQLQKTAANADCLPRREAICNRVNRRRPRYPRRCPSRAVISPTLPGSPRATAPEHPATSRTRPPATTPPATSSRSTPTSEPSPA